MMFFYDRFDSKTGKALFQDNEKLYYQAVRKQAQKIQGQSPDFLISGGCLFDKRKCDEKISYSDTFGFAIPTVNQIEGGLCRYSVGLNPQGLQ